MKKRISLKRKRKFKIKYTAIVIVLVIIVIFGVTTSISRRITPILIETAEIEANKFSTIIVNKAISQVLEDKINTDELFETVISNDGKIQMVDFNPVMVNQILNIATTVVQENLKLLEDGNLESIDNYDKEAKKRLRKGIITEIPLGAAFKNSIFSNIGPKIPIRLHYVGDVNSNIKTKITPYGINNALIEVGVDLEMTAQIILPFVTKKIKLNTNIPIAIKMIQGGIPDYYGSGLVKDSSLYSIPFQ